MRTASRILERSLRWARGAARWRGKRWPATECRPEVQALPASGACAASGARSASGDVPGQPRDEAVARDAANGQAAGPVPHDEAAHVGERGDLRVLPAGEPLDREEEQAGQDEHADGDGTRDAHRRTSPQNAESQAK